MPERPCAALPPAMETLQAPISRTQIYVGKISLHLASLMPISPVPIFRSRAVGSLSRPGFGMFLAAYVSMCTSRNGVSPFLFSPFALKADGQLEVAFLRAALPSSTSVAWDTSYPCHAVLKGGNQRPIGRLVAYRPYADARSMYTPGMR